MGKTQRATSSATALAEAAGATATAPAKVSKKGRKAAAAGKRNTATPVAAKARASYTRPLGDIGEGRLTFKELRSFALLAGIRQVCGAPKKRKPTDPPRKKPLVNNDVFPIIRNLLRDTVNEVVAALEPITYERMDAVLEPVDAEKPKNIEQRRKQGGLSINSRIVDDRLFTLFGEKIYGLEDNYPDALPDGYRLYAKKTTTTTPGSKKEAPGAAGEGAAASTTS